MGRTLPKALVAALNKAVGKALRDLGPEADNSQVYRWIAAQAPELHNQWCEYVERPDAREKFISRSRRRQGLPSTPRSRKATERIHRVVVRDRPVPVLPASAAPRELCHYATLAVGGGYLALSVLAVFTLGSWPETIRFMGGCLASRSGCTLVQQVWATLALGGLIFPVVTTGILAEWLDYLNWRRVRQMEDIGYRRFVGFPGWWSGELEAERVTAHEMVLVRSDGSIAARNEAQHIEWFRGGSDGRKRFSPHVIAQRLHLYGWHLTLPLVDPAGARGGARTP